MKKILIYAFAILFVASPMLMTGQLASVNWMTIEEALEAQKKDPKPIMVDVYTQWCGPCKMMDKNTFHDGSVAAYLNENFYAVKFDAESPDAVTFQGTTYENPTFDPAKVGRRNGVHQFSRALGVSAYPTLVFLDEESNIIKPLSGYRTPPQLELYLKLFGTSAYKTIDTQEKWEDYQKNFVASW